MKKILFIVLFAAAILSIVLYLIFTKSDTSSNDKNVKTQLLSAIEIEHPEYLSVFEPNDSKAEVMFKEKDLRKTSLTINQDSIENVIKRNSSGGAEGYFSVTNDFVNINNVKIVITAPTPKVKSYFEEQILMSYLLYASPQTGTTTSTTLIFELQCFNDAQSKEVTYFTLSCQQVEESLQIMAETLNITDTNAFNSYLGNEAENNKKLLEAELKRLAEYNKPKQAQNSTSLNSTDVALENKTANLNQFGKFIKVNPDAYKLDNVVLSKSFGKEDLTQIYKAIEARKISDALSLVVVDDGVPTHTYAGVVLYDEQAQKIVRVVDFPFITLSSWISTSTLVSRQVSQSGNEQIIITNYASGFTKVLYEETDPNVQLAEICEMGCKGILYKNKDNEIVFERRQKLPATSLTKPLEIKRILLPKEYIGA